MMEWFFDYIFPVFFILSFIVFIVFFVSILVINFSIFRKGFKSFQNFNVRFDGLSAGRANQNTKNYGCRHCGAALGDGPDVSPSGDVKCRYCGKWFNIHSNQK